MSIHKKLNLIFNRRQQIKFVILLAITFGGAVVETLGIAMVMPIISIITNESYIFEQPILLYLYDSLKITEVNNFLSLSILTLISVYIIKTVYLFIMYKLQFRLVFNNQMLISTKLMDSYLRKKYEYHLNENSAEVIQTVIQDVSQLFVLVLSIVQLTTEVMIITCIVAVLVIIDPVIVLATVIFLSLIMTVFILSYRKSIKEAGVINRINNKEMIKWVSQGTGGIKDVKVLKCEDFFINQYSRAAKKYAESQRRYHFLNQAPRLFIETICVCMMLFVVLVSLYLGEDISSMVPKLSVFAMAAFRIMPSFSRITSCYNMITFTTPSIDRVYKTLKDSQDESDKERLASIGTEKKEISIKSDTVIKITDLSYKYPNAESYVLKKASFEIPIRKSIAIVGTSGAGKTTFADIFLGLFKPTEGKITVEGIDIYESPDEWSKHLGYIPQNIYLCDDTIRKNIAFGITEDKINEERVNTALEKAQLGEFIKTLPQGIDTEIGERGIRLSGGQRQRIGIARAFYNDPEIFVLDEATSALDNDTEAAVMEAINAVKGEKTLIIIAHRLSTIKNCDVVFRIKEGKVILENMP